ncbi:uncharacterized protein A4U43_C06F10590 [Asparagus officinalis]|uniref:Uncharacterized protein n=1 Tax=Asparagus officinalis TaxID=4686 RepID=A0A5P1ELK2_ASPOF|nr:uncharacterized protein A4U43_C06F10590 [Asparagus officinalis]
MYGWMENIQTLYLQVLGDVASLRADRGANLEQATETSALGSSKVNRLKQELKESKRKARRLEEAFQERDRDMVLVKIKKEAAVHERRRLDEEHTACQASRGGRPLIGVFGRSPKP